MEAQRSGPLVSPSTQFVYAPVGNLSNRDPGQAAPGRILAVSLVLVRQDNILIITIDTWTFPVPTLRNGRSSKYHALFLQRCPLLIELSPGRLQSPGLRDHT